MDGLWHQLVLIWIREPTRFHDYLTAMAPIVRRYGGTADHSFLPTAIHADGLTTPNLVNLVHYDSRASFDAFTNDPDFQRIKHLRDESVDLLSFNGRLVHKHPAPPEPGRIYRIEIAQFPDGSPEADRRNKHDRESATARYGFQVDYVLDIDTTSSAERRFDLLKISSFPSNTQRAAFESDPPHTGIESALHHATADDLIRIDATSAPATQP